MPEDGFDDVPHANTHESAIDCVVWWRIANGVAPGRYGPSRRVERGQVASFLVRTLHHTSRPLPVAGADRFRDDRRSVHEPAIDQLAGAGIATGFPDATFRPKRPITRGELATLLVRVLEHAGGRALAAGPDRFGDDDGSAHEANIDKAAAAGIVEGGPDGRYAPSQYVRRDQMGSFLARTLQWLDANGHLAPRP